MIEAWDVVLDTKVPDEPLPVLNHLLVPLLLGLELSPRRLSRAPNPFERSERVLLVGDLPLGRFLLRLLLLHLVLMLVNFLLQCLVRVSEFGSG